MSPRGGIGTCALGIVLTVLTLDVGVGAPADGRRDSRGLVFRQALDGRGTLRMYAREQSERLCLKLVRRFRAERRSRSDSWTSCRLPQKTQRVRVRNRIACAPGEMQHMGVAPARTSRLWGRLASGRRIRIDIHAAPPGIGATGKLFARVVKRGELARLRAFDSRERVLDTTRVPLYRGPWPCPDHS